MTKRMIFSAALAAFVAAPLALSAQQGAVTVCKDKTTTTATGAGACSSHGGVDRDATSAKNAKTGAQKVNVATETAAKNTEKAVGKGATDAAKATSKAASNTSKAVSKGAEDAGKGAKGVAKETTGDVTNATAAGATATCKDGTYSHAKQHAGACAKHGGVAQWRDGKTH